MVDGAQHRDGLGADAPDRDDASPEGLVFANASRAHMAESLGTLPAAKRGDPDFFIGNRIRTCISETHSGAASERLTKNSWWPPDVGPFQKH